MAYTPNTLSLLNQVIEGAVKKWIYITADSLATVLGASYITDADKHRMQVGDIVEVLSGTLNTTGLTEGAAVFSPEVGVISPFTAAPQYMLCQVSSKTGENATLVEIGAGTTSTSLVGFYGATPVAQPHATAESTVATTAITTLVTTPTATDIATAVNSLISRVAASVTLVNQLQTDLVSLGLIKGSY